VGSTVSVNDRTINIPDGRNVSIINGVVMVDGKAYTDEPEPGKPLSIDIKVSGPLANLEVKGNNTKVTCGDVKGSVRTSGSVKAGNVGGDVKTQGSVTCGDVGQGVKTMGSVTCGKVGGNISTMGSVSRR
jgi:hypothetical protein